MSVTKRVGYTGCARKQGNEQGSAGEEYKRSGGMEREDAVQNKELAGGWEECRQDWVK